MTITIHRGTHEIGGICIELANSHGERILLDAGKPLEDHPEGPAFDQERMAEAVASVNARGILLAAVYSHGHQDHLGFDGLIAPEITRWLGIDTLALYRLRHAAGFLRDRSGDFKPDWEHYRTYESGTPFKLGHFDVTPWIMDHSAMDAYALEVEADGQRLIFTGDFRAHGRKGKVLDHFLRQVRPVPHVLLSEGTTMSREGKAFPETESVIEDRLAELSASTEGHIFVQCSAENIDRIVGLYRACKRSGRTLVVDLYTALVLQTVSVHHERIPCPGKRGWANLKVWYPQPLTKMLVENLGQNATVYHFRHVQLKRVEFETSGKVMMLVRPTMQAELAHWLGVPGKHAFVYSMWAGYLNEAKTGAFVDFMAGKGAALHQIHTSGHADPATIRKVMETLSPRKLIPVHTQSPESFDVFGATTKCLRDGVTFCCSNIEDPSLRNITPNRQFKEIASWQLAAALIAQYPERYRLVEQHPCDGMYDVLALFARDSRKSEAHINRSGSLHATEGDRLEALWERLLNGTPFMQVLRLVHEVMRLPPPQHSLDLSESASDLQITVSVMTAVIDQFHWAESHWEWRMGLLDGSSWSELRKDAYEAFPGIEAWGDTAPNDLELWSWYCNAYDYWFLYRDGMPLAVAHVSGLFQIRGGERQSLRKACAADGWKVGLTARRLVDSLIV